MKLKGTIKFTLSEDGHTMLVRGSATGRGTLDSYPSIRFDMNVENTERNQQIFQVGRMIEITVDPKRLS